jgi:Domain of unknown function (DUF4405)
LARGAERSFLGIDRLTWIDLHDWVGLLLAAVIVVHVGLNLALGDQADPSAARGPRP